MWLCYICPGCDRSWVLEVAPGQVWLGDFDEFPPSLNSFTPLDAYVLPGLQVQLRPDGLLLTLDGQHWQITAVITGTCALHPAS